MRIATYNVNSINVRLPIVLEWLRRCRPDILCLQETKTPDARYPEAELRAAGYFSLFSGQKGGNGVAILSREAGKPVARGFDDGKPSDPARFIATRFNAILVVNTYVPQGRALDHPVFAYKLEWFERLRKWFERHADPAEPVIWTGDLNVAPDPIDVHHPERHTQHVCFHASVRAAYAQTTAWGFVDLYRKHNPEGGYSFFDYRTRDAVERGLGWRIDHILATPPLAGICRDCRIDLKPRMAPRPSDHTPVFADFDGVQRA